MNPNLLTKKNPLLPEEIQGLVEDGIWKGPTLDYKFEFKKLDDEGEFEGFASTWEKDSYGDIILPGAFTRTIKSWRRSGLLLPVLWQHFYYEPIGGIYPDAMEEQKKGLYVKGKLLLSIPRAVEARDLLVEKIIRGMSIGFTIPKGKADWSDDYTERYIREVKLWENSVVTFPANKGAKVTQVKQALEAGLRDKRTERLRLARKRMDSSYVADSLLKLLEEFEL